MATLVDTFLYDQKDFKGKWFVAKPLGKLSLFQRFKDAIGVLTGKYVAVYFYEDTKEFTK